MPEKSPRSRLISQLLCLTALVLATVFLIGLCTNAIVLPFFNLSGAVVSTEENLIPSLSKPTDLAETDKLSFLEMLTHFADAPEGAVRSGEVYGGDSSLQLCEMPEGVLPLTGEVGGETALVARMGFLLCTNQDQTRTLFSADGELILETMPEDMQLIGQWDQNENAVFVRAGEYVYYNAETKAFEPSPYVPELSAISGVDLPVYYERPDSRIALSYRDGLYGFYYTDTGEANYQYTHAGQSYQFKEGYGALGTEDDGIIFVNYVAKRFFFTWGKFLQPEGEGIEKLGYYRMDHGLLLVSREKEDGTREDLILTEANQIFYLPRDFELVCYTDGVFLLEKDGRYGFLDYTGRWIADPVYVSATPFSEGLAVVEREDGKKGVIDTSGTFVIPCEFDEITGASGGVLTLYSSGRWVVLHKLAPASAGETTSLKEETA